MNAIASPRAPGPRGFAALRATLHFLRDPLDYLVTLRQYGEVVRTATGPYVFHTFFDPRGIRHVFVNHPERFSKRGVIDDLTPVLGDGLLTAVGAIWKERRSALMPCLTRAATSRIVPVVDESVRSIVSRWKPGDVIDATDEMMRMALIVVGRALFDVSLGERVAEVSAAVEQVSRLAFRRSKSIIKLPFRVPTPGNRAYGRAIQTLRSLVDDIVNQAGQRSAFMRQLHQATNNSPDALRDEVMTFLLAGHETTASTLAWTLAHVSRDAQLQNRAREQIRTVVSGDDALTDKQVEQLPLVDAMISEAMRLYPPGWLLMRRAQESDEVLGFAVPRGSFVVAPVYALHRHPDYWNAPDRFDADRFLDPSVPVDPLVYIPFGVGPRRCIGETFARIEMRILLARLLDRFRLEPLGEIPQPQPLTTLRPRDPVRVRLL